jgi:hypothetical protein
VTWQHGRVRTSEFWALVDDEFGESRGRALVKDQVLQGLRFRTAQAALSAGDDLRDIWFALCDEMDVPQGRRWGRTEQAAPKSPGKPR